MSNSYKSTCEAIRSSIIESQQFPLFRQLLESSPIDYSSEKSDVIIKALLSDETLSKYSIISIFDDRVLVTDNGHSFYYLPYEIDSNNKLKFKTIIPVSLVQNESLLVKKVLIDEIQKMTEAYRKGKISENVDKIIRLGLEKLRLDSLDHSLEKRMYEEFVPVMMVRFPLLAEGWEKYSKENTSNKLVKKVSTIVESCEVLYSFRQFLENEKGIKYGHYLNTSDVDPMIEEYANFRGEDLTEMERATIINFFKNRVQFIMECSLVSKKMLNEYTDDPTVGKDFYDIHPDYFGQELSADFTPDNTALNQSLLINYKPLLVDARAFLAKLASGTLPGDLKKVVSTLLLRVDTFIVRIETNYQWAMQDMYDLQDLLRTVNKMISIASGLDTIKATVGVEDYIPSTSTPTPDSLSPTKTYLGDEDTLEITGTGNAGNYPRGFYSKTPVGNAYPEPSRVGESVIIRDGMYFREGRVKNFNIYTGLYEVQTPDGKIYTLDDYQIDFNSDNKSKEEDEPVMPTIKKDDKDKILVDKGKEYFYPT